MHVLAEKYDLQGLKDVCVARFAASHWRRLKPEEQLILTEDVYNNTRDTDQLREVVRTPMVDHIKSMAKLKDFQQFLHDTPDFAYDAIKELSVWGDVNRKRYCYNCDERKHVEVRIDRCEEIGPRHDRDVIEHIQTRE